MDSSNNKLGTIFLGILVVGLAVFCLAAIFMGVKWFGAKEPLPQAAVSTTTIPASEEPAMVDMGPTQSASTTASSEGTITMQILEDTLVPENDPLELAARFNGVSDPRASLKEEAVTKANGSKQPFWILDVDSNDYRQITAVLAYQTPHLYFWVEEGIEYDEREVAQLADVFENQIYPTDRQYFGNEWSPGVDNDPHLVIIYAHQLGGAAGYFSGSDSLTPEVSAYSNAAEMFYLSADYTDLNSSYTYGVLAHEFQHMIHWNQDRNETSWLNEGFSELAVDLNGFDVGGFDMLFAFQPDLQLNFWPGDDQGDSAPHYGASFLFTRYLLSQFGSPTTTAIVHNPMNGLVSIDEVLQPEMAAYEAYGPAANRPADQVFQNWSIANYLQEADGIYSYKEYPMMLPFYTSEALDCDGNWYDRTVSQYGTDYIQVNCEGEYQIEVVGQDTVALLPADPHSGDYYFWSNSGDESHMTLSRSFDFSAVNGPIAMSYWAWYDIERDYDYAYLTASTDGENWQILDTSTCTTDNPTGASYGCGLNGASGGWVQETVDLSAFAGQTVTLQFEYITDAAVNGEGLLVDDVRIDALDYAADFEEDNGGWEAAGFVRISNELPQAYALAWLQPDTDEPVQKWMTAVGLSQSIEPVGAKKQQAGVLAISGLTRHTHMPAVYRVRVTRINY
ncbi:MAG: immune inhibitor [Chloroflexota bacterium]|nr:immune inhibitor [Chloroflexota bacterium]